MTARAKGAGSGYILGPAYRVSLVREGGAAPQAMASPRAAALELLARVPDDGREHFGCVFLDVRHNATGLLVVSVGCLTGSLVHPREVFGPAMVAKAAGLILWHNHPSGEVEPSPEDLALTRRFASAGELLGIQVLDHVILAHGTGRWLSLKERGVL